MEMLRQLLKKIKKGEKILVCTPSNKAADLILIKIETEVKELVGETIRVHSGAKYNWDLPIAKNESDPSISS